MHATTPTPNELATRKHLERALSTTDDPEVRFHLRQALQLLV